MSNNYNVESNIDFYNELYKLLDVEDSDEVDNTVCLISNQPLVHNCVKLNCGHVFNYLPLFNDILAHKNKFNLMESYGQRLTNEQIRCPYCRKIQQGVLPYYEELVLEKVNGVNYFDPSLTQEVCAKPYHYHSCDFLTPNINFNPEMEENNTNNAKYKKCTKCGSKMSGIQYDNTKYYCYYHKIEVKKDYETIFKQKVKEEKQKAKEEKQKLKDELKQKVKEEKQKAKHESKDESKDELKQKVKKIKKINIVDENIVDENIVIDQNSEVVNNNFILCNKILQSGINKGKQCKFKVFKDGLCKKHCDNKSNM